MGRGADRREDEGMPVADPRSLSGSSNSSNGRRTATCAIRGLWACGRTRNRAKWRGEPKSQWANKRRIMISFSREAVPGVVQGFGRY